MDYKICAWDVGIKNLSYCILHITDNKWTILDWDDINISSIEKHICEGTINKGNKPCIKNASFFGKDIDGKVQYFCGTHKKIYKPYPETWEIDNILEYKDADRCMYETQTTKTVCGKKAYSIIDNKTYCNNHKKIIVNRIKKDVALVKIKKQSCYKVDLQILAEKMYSKLDSIKDLTDVDCVRIENQPTLKNPTMKTISSFLFGYFVMKNTGRIKQIKFITPSIKLKLNETDTDKLINKALKNERLVKSAKKILEKAKLDKKPEFVFKYALGQQKDKNKIELEVYDIIKGLAIEYTIILLGKDEKNKKWIDYLNKYKKKDDLCDAFLHALKQTVTF